jgi:hypothetical protein
LTTDLRFSGRKLQDIDSQAQVMKEKMTNPTLPLPVKALCQPYGRGEKVRQFNQVDQKLAK